jgi:hypothetical protein
MQASLRRLRMPRRDSSSSSGATSSALIGGAEATK